jgi:hypothetical protein
VLVMAPAELIASKVVSYCRRLAQPKSFTDRRDIAVLLLQFPELKEAKGRVAEALREAKADPEIVATWEELSAQEIRSPDPDGEF